MEKAKEENKKKRVNWLSMPTVIFNFIFYNIVFSTYIWKCMYIFSAASIYMFCSTHMENIPIGKDIIFFLNI